MARDGIAAADNIGTLHEGGVAETSGFQQATGEAGSGGGLRCWGDLGREIIKAFKTLWQGRFHWCYGVPLGFRFAPVEDVVDEVGFVQHG